MKLGNFAEISVAVPDLSKSLFFFERLGFEKADQNWEPWPWVVLSDGTITLNLSQSTPSEPMVAYMASDMHERLDQLEALGVSVTRIEDPQVSELVGALETPSGVGLSFLEYPVQRIPRRSGRSTCKCGQFAELAVAVPDLQSSLDFWIRLGFRRAGGSSLPYPWAVVTDDLLNLGLYQTKDFKCPALVYNSINVAERIEQLETEGFEFVAQMPSPGDGTGRWILESPDGQLLVFLEYREV